MASKQVADSSHEKDLSLLEQIEDIDISTQPLFSSPSIHLNALAGTRNVVSISTIHASSRSSTPTQVGENQQSATIAVRKSEMLVGMHFFQEW